MEWKLTEFGSWQAYVGSIRLFTVTLSLTREPGGNDIVLRTDLPGFAKLAGKRRWPSDQAAKAEAERLWDMFKTYVQTHEKETVG